MWVFYLKFVPFVASTNDFMFNLTGLYNRNRSGMHWNTPYWLHHWLPINIESSCHLHCTHQLYVCLSWLTCESSEAGLGSSAARVARSWLRYALSRAGERCSSAKTPPRSGLPASAICTEPKGGSNKGSRREEEEEEEEGGPNKRVPQRTLAGSNPAWALFQHRKLPAVRLECDAGRTITDSSRRERDEKGKRGNRKERVMRAAADSVWWRGKKMKADEVK